MVKEIGRVQDPEVPIGVVDCMSYILGHLDWADSECKFRYRSKKLMCALQQLIKSSLLLMVCSKKGHLETGGHSLRWGEVDLGLVRDVAGHRPGPGREYQPRHIGQQ
jgi:hypothetical protein